jgi:hypothetical protein
MYKKTLGVFLSMYHIDNDKSASHIEKDTVTMISQHYHSSDRSKCITTIYQQCLLAMFVLKIIFIVQSSIEKDIEMTILKT